MKNKYLPAAKHKHMGVEKKISNSYIVETGFIEPLQRSLPF